MFVCSFVCLTALFVCKSDDSMQVTYWTPPLCLPTLPPAPLWSLQLLQPGCSHTLVTHLITFLRSRLHSAPGVCSDCSQISSELVSSSDSACHHATSVLLCERLDDHLFQSERKLVPVKLTLNAGFSFDEFLPVGAIDLFSGLGSRLDSSN